MPMSALISRWISRPRAPTKLVSSPAILGRMPVARRTGLETIPPTKPARRAPFERSNQTEAEPLRFTVQRIGVDKESQPEAVKSRVGDAQHQSIENVTDQGTKQLAALFRRPVQRQAAAATGQIVSGPRNHQNIP